MHSSKVHIAVFVAAAGGLLFLVLQTISSGDLFASTEEQAVDVVEEQQISPFIYKEVSIEENDTFGVVMERAGVSGTDSMNIYNASVDVYDLARVRVGRVFVLGYDRETNELVSLMYPVNSEEELHVEKQADGSWQAESTDIEYEIKTKTVGGTIETSMYEAALSAGIDERAIIDLANVFQWSVDFALEVRKGDNFVFTYEERYRNGEYVMPGKIIAGKFNNDGRTYYTFGYTDSEGENAYYDEEANSVQKMFLKAPVEFKYISSGFTTGLRYVQAFNTSTGHRAIDYAATYGTPIRSVGDGTVVQAGWNGPYGNFVSVRHNGTYTTNYAHMSRIAVKNGQRVSQGEIIGYVGSTGFSTGPHLHYEMVKNGAKINPLLEVLPPGEAISADALPAYKEFIAPLKSALDNFTL